MEERQLELSRLAHEFEPKFNATYYKRRKRFQFKNLSKGKKQEVIKWLQSQTCYACGSPKNLHRHHKLPLSCGGSNDWDNIVALCKDCHEWIHGHEFKPKKAIPKPKKKKETIFVRRNYAIRPKKETRRICGHGRVAKWCTDCRY